ncbi:MAG: sensor histidine kinase [Bacteroidota bacterium]
MLSSIVRYLAVLLIVPVFGIAQIRVYDPGEKAPLVFRAAETEYTPGKYLMPGADQVSFEYYGNDTLPNSRPSKDRMVTMVAEVNTDSWPPGIPLAVSLPPFEYAANIYWNGKLIAVKGNAVGGYTNRTHFCKSVLITPQQFDSGRSNILTIQLYPLYGENYKPFGTVYLGGNEIVSREEYLRNTFGPMFSFALLCTGLMLFAYYLVNHFSGQTGNQYTYLLFAFINVTTAASQFNNAFSSDYSDVLFLERISRTGYILKILFDLLFVIEYTGFVQRKKSVYGILFGIFCAATILTISNPTYITINRTYHQVVEHLMQPALIILLLMLGWNVVKQRSLLSMVFLLIFLIDYACMYHDAIFFMAYHQKPFVNLMPFGYFILNLFLLVQLGLDQKKLKDSAILGEQAEKKINRELNQIVKSRTDQLNTMVKNLRQEVFVRTATQLKLDQTVSVKNKLFSIISHDLKNVFNSMISFTEFISEDIGNGRIGDLESDVKKLSLASKRAFFLLENLLEWSITELNMAKVNPERIELDQIIQECIDLFLLPMEEKGLSMDIHGSGHLAVHADRRMLQTILRNLISNAVKYSFERSVITVEVNERTDHIEIAVKDSGKGLPDGEDVMKKELLKSVQGTSQERGSGIGLYIVKEFLELHRSSLSVVSTAGKGCTFGFRLPKAQQQ